MGGVTFLKKMSKMDGLIALIVCTGRSKSVLISQEPANFPAYSSVKKRNVWLKAHVIEQKDAPRCYEAPFWGCHEQHLTVFDNARYDARRLAVREDERRIMTEDGR